MKLIRVLALFLALIAVAAACSDDATESIAADEGVEGEEVAAPTADGTDGAADDPADEGAEGEADSSANFPVTIESGGGTWTLAAAPERIVSLSPTATEILFAIGAGDQVVAVDAFSNHPPEAPTTDLSGWEPNVEAVVAYEPDLVVIANDANDLVAALTALDIPVLINPAPVDLETGYDGMASLGLATGKIDETAEAVAMLRADLDAAFAEAPEAPVRVYHEIDETFYSASSASFIGAVYTRMGAENIADPADADGFGFPQLTEEYIVEADPQVIVITDQVTYTAEDLAARPGWDQISAVQNGNIVVVEADTASRWGPRLPLFVAEVAAALAAVETAEAGSGSG